MAQIQVQYRSVYTDEAGDNEALTREPHIAIITLNNPTQKNAMTAEMAKSFKELCNHLNEHKHLRAVVVTGADNVFSAGGDFAMLKSFAENTIEENAAGMYNFYRSFLCVLDLKVPTVAAINGHAIGAALSFACAHDIRIASDTGTFAFNFVKIGIHPGMGATLFAPKHCGQSIGNELLLTGRRFNASDALAWGLFNQVAAPTEVLPRATHLALEIAKNGPLAVRQTAQTLRRSMLYHDHELEIVLRYESQCQAINYQTEEFKMAIAAAEAKKAIEFT